MKKLCCKVFVAVSVLLIAGCSQSIGTTDASDGALLESRSTVLASKPFPQSENFTGCIKPGVNQDQINTDVRDFYTYWANRYLKVSNGNTPGGGYYVEADSTGSMPPGWGSVKAKSQSEAHGYGMVITAIMGEKEKYDGLYNMYDNYRSVGNRELMSWVIPSTEDQSLPKSNSASDGDLDIAYSLLLADVQWGSNGAINYKAQAIKMINAIKASDFSATSKRVLRGDWDSSTYSTRSSDWMVSHFRAFKVVTGDNFWSEAEEEVYRIIDEITTNYSSNTYLMPDFIEGAIPKPDTYPFLEAETDDDYSWNACRYPWRISMGYAHFGEVRAKNAVDQLVNWAKTQVNGDFFSFKAGYTLAGSPLVSYSSNAFTSPIIAASIVSNDKTFLDSGWDHMKIQASYNSYFGDSITMLCMLFASGNWWNPVDVVIIPDTEAPSIPTNLTGINDNGTLKLTWNPSTDNVGVVGYEVRVNDGTTTKLYNSTTNSISIPLSNPKLDVACKVYAYDAAQNVSQYSSEVIVAGIVGPIVPEDPKATGKPGTPSLSKNNWNGDPNYAVTMNMWWGNNGTLIKLYENDILIKTINPSFNSPSAQKEVFNFSSKPVGEYKYRCELINQYGVTSSGILTVNVTH